MTTTAPTDFLTWGQDLDLAAARTPLPSVYKQTHWPLKCQPFLLPNDPDIQYFNPTLAEWNGLLYLITRRFHRPAPHGQNSITFWLLDNNLVPSLETPLTFPSPRPNDNWEDPRAVALDKRLYLSFAHWRNAPSYFVCQGLAQIDYSHKTMVATDVCFPRYGGNSVKGTPHPAHEKNWLWFQHDEALHFVYHSAPHIVVRWDEHRPVSYPTRALSWPYGAIRGGTPPILHDSLYWSFFHSSIDIRNDPPRRRYYMGAYAFAAQPPFTPVCLTLDPLLAGSEADPRDAHAPLCVFPGGAHLTRDEDWIVALGVNDCRCAWLQVPHSELTQRMTYL